MELQELAQRIRRGDRDALKALISEYGVGIYQKAYQKTQDKVLAREATRQTFAQLVTALQEQTDMDGWELWLNALAKKNIDTYSNIGADMAYLENQLDTELFSPAAQAAPQQETARRFAMQQQLLAQEAAKRQHEAQQAQLLAAQQQEAQQAQLLQQQQEAQRQYEAQQKLQQYEAQLQMQQYEAQQAETPAQPPEAPRPSAAKSAPEPPETQAPRPAGVRKPHGKERHADGRKPSVGSAWPVIVLLVVLCIALVWLVIGVAMSLNWLPKLDLGYAWFNEHILELF